MQEVFDFIKDLIDAERLAALAAMYGGFYLVAFIIFAETGLFAGFFLPGDSLLFITGVMLANAPTPFEGDLANLAYWISLIGLAGILGNRVGYWFGQRAGPGLYKRKDSLLFKRKYIIEAKEFYDKHGGRAIVLARFFPFLRTFAPIVAGVVQMDRRKYFLYNVIGSIAWVASMMLAGFYFGDNEWVKRNFEKVILGFGIFTIAPIIYKMFSRKKDPTLMVGKEVVEESLGLHDGRKSERA
jgi:membrane-associated protein